MFLTCPSFVPYHGRDDGVPRARIVQHDCVDPVSQLFVDNVKRVIIRQSEDRLRMQLRIRVPEHKPNPWTIREGTLVVTHPREDDESQLIVYVPRDIIISVRDAKTIILSRIVCTSRITLWATGSVTLDRVVVGKSAYVICRNASILFCDLERLHCDASDEIRVKGCRRISNIVLSSIHGNVYVDCTAAHRFSSSILHGISTAVVDETKKMKITTQCGLIDVRANVIRRLDLCSTVGLIRARVLNMDSLSIITTSADVEIHGDVKRGGVRTLSGSLFGKGKVEPRFNTQTGENKWGTERRT